MIFNPETFIQEMKVSKMYELPGDTGVRWAMIEHTDSGYCWTVGLKGTCTTLYSSGPTNDIKFWATETEAKSDLIKTLERAAKV